MGLSIDEYDKTEESSAIPPMPPFEEIVELLYDEELCFPDEITVARVIYSKDKSKRFTILKNGKGLYMNRYEEIWTYFEEEWVHMYNGGCTCPGWWQDVDRGYDNSYFGTEEEALAALMASPDFKYEF